MDKSVPNARVASEQIDAMIAGLGDWRGDTLSRMRKLIRQADARVAEEVKWAKASSPGGVPVWSHDGIICTGETYKSVVKLTFAKGASLPDPSGLFNSSLGGGTRRAIDIREGEKVDATAFKALVRAAVALNTGGAKAGGRARAVRMAAAKPATRVARPVAGVAERRTQAAGAKPPSKARASTQAPRASVRATAPGKKRALLSGGNPQIAKADGDAPVRAYIAAMPDWKRDVGRRLDALVVRNVPHVRKAVKWNSPFYGVEGQGWFLSFHVFARYVKVTFFNGAALRPVPPGGGKDKDARWVDVYEGDLDERQMAAWIRQAAARPGWSGS
jgi:hypothetical protein